MNGHGLALQFLAGGCLREESHFRSSTNVHCTSNRDMGKNEPCPKLSSSLSAQRDRDLLFPAQGAGAGTER